MPKPRFSDNGNGTVTDNMTGLIWLKNADCFGTKTWDQALADANELANGSCGLTDSSSAGDWRLSNKKELISLTHDGYYYPALPSGHPFNNVKNGYWSSTTYAVGTSYAWVVDMGDGVVVHDSKVKSYYVWPVRGGH